MPNSQSARTVDEYNHRTQEIERYLGLRRLLDTQQGQEPSLPYPGPEAMQGLARQVRNNMRQLTARANMLSSTNSQQTSRVIGQNQVQDDQQDSNSPEMRIQRARERLARLEYIRRGHLAERSMPNWNTTNRRASSSAWLPENDLPRRARTNDELDITGCTLSCDGRKL